MGVKFDGYNWLVRLNTGDELVSKLQEIARSEDIKTAWISGIGAASSVKTGLYDTEKKEYKWRDFSGDIEILSLQGNIAWDDKHPALHIHGSFSDENMNGFGGHVKELIVGATCELFLHNWFSSHGIVRSEDPKTGLKLLDL